MIKNKKLVIFGSGTIAQLANFYFEKDSEYEVVAFTVNKVYCINNTFENKPLIPFEEISNSGFNKDVFIFVAISYTGMNKVRANIYNSLKDLGYKFASYISSKCTYLSQFPPGENVFILEDNTIQPYVKIGNNVTLWSGNHIGHHSIIEDHNFISSHVVISGFCVVNSFCFIGVNATIAHKVRIASASLIGAGATISKDTDADAVYVPSKSIKLAKNSFSIDL